VTSEAAQSEAIGWAGRAGLVAKGIPYVLIGWLALRVAFGDRGRTADRTGALREVSHHTLGKTVLVALAAGFAGYALWRFAEAVLNRNGDEWPKRVGAFAKGALYVGFAWAALKVVIGSDPGSNEKHETAHAFGLPLGRELVFCIGGGFAVAAVYNVYRGVTRDFMDDMRTRSDWIESLGVVGHLARALVWAIVAWFLVKAALQYDAREAVGLDGALAKLVRRDYGELVLSVTAAGLFAYGLFCFAQARFREV
jgi:Domain of Unknown Function (DUF1206)